MAIRESLLNTITSVASSDFVRLVTSAGESSKATVANLFKSFESGLGAKSSLTTSDYIRVVGSDNNVYKQSVSAVATTMGIDALTTKTSVSVTASTNVVIDVNKSYKLGKILFLNVKGHTTAYIANAYLFTFSGASPDPYNFTFGIPIGSGAWEIDGIAYGYINQGAVTAIIQSGKYFHIAQAFICS